MMDRSEGLYGVGDRVIIVSEEIQVTNSQAGRMGTVLSARKSRRFGSYCLLVRIGTDEFYYYDDQVRPLNVLEKMALV